MGTLEASALADQWVLSNDIEELIASLLDDENATKKILDIVTDAYLTGCRIYSQEYIR